MDFAAYGAETLTQDRVCSTPFSYFPLRDGSIRLIDLQPVNNQDHVNYTICDHPLRGPIPPYAAISYRWNERLEKTAVHLNGHELRVRSNVSECLHHLVQIAQWRYVWIDSICINQNDLQERSRQVNIVGGIYRTAVCVLIWLDVANDELTKAVGVIRTADFVKEERLDPVSKFPFTAGSHGIVATLSQVDRAWKSADGLPTANEAESLCKNLRPLVGLDYWERTWIIQEIRLARDVRLLCGALQVPWSTLKRALDFLCPMMGDDDELPEKKRLRADAHAVLLLLRDEEKYAPFNPDEKQMTLFSVLHRYSSSKCSDIRDKIYGLLSIQNAGKLCGLRANYAWTPEELLVTALKCAHCPRPGYKAGYRGFNDAEFLQSLLNIQACEKDFISWMQSRCTRTDSKDAVCFTYNDGSALKIPSMCEFMTREALLRKTSGQELAVENYENLLRELEHTAGSRAGAAVRNHVADLIRDRSLLERFVIDNPLGVDSMSQLSEVAVHSPTSMKVFIDEEGGIGITCPSARPGDILYKSYCLFTQPPILLVLRGAGTSFKVVGRALYNSRPQVRLRPQPERPPSLIPDRDDIVDWVSLHPLTLLSLTTPVPGKPPFQ